MVKTYTRVSKASPKGSKAQTKGKASKSKGRAPKAPEKRAHTDHGPAPKLATARKLWPNFRKGSSTEKVAKLLVAHPAWTFSELKEAAIKQGVDKNTAAGAIVRLKRPGVYFQ